MDWEEVRVRVGQELHKQSDLLMHRMGVRNWGDSAETQGRRRGRTILFFRASFLALKAQSARKLLRKHLPDEAEILREADEICGHRFRLLGYENLDYGRCDRLASRSGAW
jgi:hypothetical protein